MSDALSLGWLAKDPLKKGEIYLDKVIDGDTILLKDGRYVRLIGIDTPEVRRKIDGKWVDISEPYSREATEFLKKILYDKKITLDYDSEIKDSYNRELCYVYSDGILVNDAILKEGLAFPYLKNKKLKYYQRLKNAFYEAVRQQKNIYKINLKGEKNLNKYVGKDVFYEGVVRNIHLGSSSTELIFDNLIVIAEGSHRGIKRGDYLFAYGKLTQKNRRFIIISQRNRIFYFD